MSLLRTLHAWMGLILSLALATMALSGASLAFKPQWLRATVPHAAEPFTTTPSAAASAVGAAEVAFGAKAVRTVIFAGPEIGVHEVILKDGGGGYLDPRTGVVIQRWKADERTVDWLFNLHHHLLSGDTGTKVAGTIGILAATMAMTGMILWLPGARSFKGRIVPRGGKRAGWLAAHRDLGVIAFPLVLLMTLTGASLALDDLAAGLMGFQRAKPPTATAGKVDWPQALALAAARVPDGTLRMASLPAKGKPVAIRLRRAAEWHANGRTTVFIDPGSGEVLRIDDALAQPAGARLFNGFWPVHASKVGGLPWKGVTFLTGLALAALSIYGAESYRKRLFPARRRPA